MGRLILEKFTKRHDQILAREGGGVKNVASTGFPQVPVKQHGQGLTFLFRCLGTFGKAKCPWKPHLDWIFALD